MNDAHNNENGLDLQALLKGELLLSDLAEMQEMAETPCDEDLDTDELIWNIYRGR